MKLFQLSLLFLCFLGGCKQQHEMVLNFSEEAEFFANGFPSDIKQRADGGLNLAGFPRANHPFTKDYVQAINDLNTGYSPLMPIYVAFSGNPNSKSVIISNDPMSYTQLDSNIQLLDIDPHSPNKGKRYPLKASLNAINGLYRPQGLLQVIPEGPLLRAANQYALIKPLMRALETDFVGDELPVTTEELIVPTLEWAELEQLAAPVAANHQDGRTVGVVRYAEDGIKSGHYVTFQYEQPKHQIGCFLESLYQGTPVIVQGDRLHGNCQ